MSIQGLSASIAQPAVAATALLAPAANGLAVGAQMNTGTGVAIHSPEGELAEVAHALTRVSHDHPKVFNPDDTDAAAAANGGSGGAQAGDGAKGAAGAEQLGNLLSGLLKIAAEGISKAIPAMGAMGA